jgi:hypothetical protein
MQIRNFLQRRIQWRLTGTPRVRSDKKMRERKLHSSTGHHDASAAFAQFQREPPMITRECEGNAGR